MLDFGNFLATRKIVLLFVVVEKIVIQHPATQAIPLQHLIPACEDGSF